MTEPPFTNDQGLRDARASRETERRHAVIGAVGAWLDQNRWAHFASLTFRELIGPDLAARVFREWIRRLERSSKSYVSYFVGDEVGEAGGRYHLHALVGGTAHLPVHVLDNAWRHGYTRIQSYRPGGGATWYASKFTHADFSRHDMSRRFPPLQRAAA